MESEMEKEMETRLRLGFYRVIYREYMGIILGSVD